MGALLSKPKPAPYEEDGDLVLDMPICVGGSSDYKETRIFNLTLVPLKVVLRVLSEPKTKRKVVIVQPRTVFEYHSFEYRCIHINPSLIAVHAPPAGHPYLVQLSTRREYDAATAESRPLQTECLH